MQKTMIAVCATLAMVAPVATTSALAQDCSSEGIKQVIADDIGAPVSLFEDSSTLLSDYDEMQRIAIIMAIEENYGMILDDEEVSRIVQGTLETVNTIGDLITITQLNAC